MLYCHTIPYQDPIQWTLLMDYTTEKYPKVYPPTVYRKFRYQLHRNLIVPDDHQALPISNSHISQWRMFSICCAKIGIAKGQMSLNPLLHLQMVNNTTSVSPHYAINGHHPNIGLSKLLRQQVTNDNFETYVMQINALLRQVHHRVTLTNNEADHKH